MKRLTKLSLALVSVLVLSGLVAASAAQAVRGPYFKVGGSANFMEESAKKILSLAQAVEPFVLKSNTGQVIECPKVHVNGVIWNLLPLRGDFLGDFTFLECKVTGNGTGCAVTNETILTNPVLALLGYAGPGRAGGIWVIFHPDTGKVFVTVPFTGANCTFTETPVEGEVIGEAFANGKAVEVGKNEVEQAEGELRFGSTLKVITTETSSGALVTTKAILKAFGVAASFSGRSLLDVGNNEAWGIFTS